MRYSIGSAAGLAAAVLACGSGGSGTTSPDAAMACGQACMDAIALRSLRLAIKNVYNATIQGGPVGPQDQTIRCIPGGTAHIFGQASSNASQGTTRVDLTYVLDHCAFSETDSDPMATFHMTLTGTVLESGTIAVQPSSTTSLQLGAKAMSLSGTVYYPSIAYDERNCDVVVWQAGNGLSGTMCGRDVGLTL